jgi:hypothetical protein
LAWLVLFVVALSNAPNGQTVSLRYADAQSVLAALPGLSPIELKGLDSSQAGARWSAWVTRHDLDIRSRIDGGDQDTIVNWLIAGTSFTKADRRADSRLRLGVGFTRRR